MFRAVRILCLGVPLFAAGPLTLPEALALAERNHPQIQVASALIEGAESAIVSARAYPNPEAGVLAGHQRARLPGTVPGTIQVYSFAQPLETRQVRATRIQSSQAGLDSSRQARDEVRIAVRALVRQSFYLALRRKAELELATQNQRLVEDLRRRIQVQVAVGEAARLELTRADAEAAVARTNTKSAQLHLVAALAALRAAVNVPPDEELDPQGQLDPPASLPPLTDLRRQVAERHPALLQAQSEIRRAELRLRNEQALRTPQPTLHSEYEHQPEVGTYRVGVSVPVPLWNKRQGPIGEAAAALKQAISTWKLRQLEINTQLESAYGRYQVATQQLAIYEEGVLKQAEAALRAAESAYRFGERGVMEVLDAQRVLRGARFDFLTAQYDRQSALIELEQLRASDLQEKQP